VVNAGRVRALALQGPPRSCGTIRNLLVEGCLVASFAMGAHACYIYVRRRIHPRARDTCRPRSTRLTKPKLVGKDNLNGWPFDIYVAHGAGRPISAAKETALLESLEGKKGQAAPEAGPFPANVGLSWLPTTRQNNVESIAVAPTICGAAAAWFAGIGRRYNVGTKLFCISGHVDALATSKRRWGFRSRG